MKSKYKYPFLGIVLIITLLNFDYARKNQVIEKVIHAQAIANGDVFYFMCSTSTDSAPKFYIKCLSDQGQTVTTINLDSTIYLDTSFQKPGKAYKNLHLLLEDIVIGYHHGPMYINFMNRDQGFIYGNRMGYGFNPFVLRTTNGGVSWHKMDSLPMNTELWKDNFFIYQKRGFMLLTQYWNLYDGKIEYYLTNNFGASWERKVIKIKDADYSIYHCDIQFSRTGLITITAHMRKKKDHSSLKRILLQSQDYGENFIQFKSH